MLTASLFYLDKKDYILEKRLPGPNGMLYRDVKCEAIHVKKTKIKGVGYVN
jgi:hypothetical protein